MNGSVPIKQELEFMREDFTHQTIRFKLNVSLSVLTIEWCFFFYN